MHLSALHGSAQHCDLHVSNGSPSLSVPPHHCTPTPPLTPTWLLMPPAVRRLKLELSAGAVDYIAKLGYDPVYGARPVKRALQRELQTLLAKVGRGAGGPSRAGLLCVVCCVLCTSSTVVAPNIASSSCWRRAAVKHSADAPLIHLTACLPPCTRYCYTLHHSHRHLLPAVLCCAAHWLLLAPPAGAAAG
jgi:hypothetical protein